ncbi:GNAT family N-acetyltransferase [Alicyclobacillus sp. SO9]|uniref:GNAT family N-acetyltransferase n=1 Tax=Alicyclobacillus sp. SO9 TaxID=2665646 RepID=UPI0018E7397A|nr:GNAT family N-acetyltransferase [Alicyclobacillus sp. SO9]QQE80236.1 GNAT family N-acetyltransferase [Alicyclobacillus sp. SO9]
MHQKSSLRPRTRRAGTKPPRGKSKAKATKTKKPELQFRPRVVEDDTYILQLTEEQLGQIHQQTFGEPFPREQFMSFIQSGAPVTVFESDGKRIGYYSYLVGPDQKMHISSLVIDKAFQSKGVGTAVMKHLEQEAVQRGVQTMEVFVQAANERSVQFTKSLGFLEAFRVPPNTIAFQKQVQVQVAKSTGYRYKA